MGRIKECLMKMETEDEEKYRKTAVKALTKARGTKKVKLHNLYVDLWGDL